MSVNVLPSSLLKTSIFSDIFHFSRLYQCNPLVSLLASQPASRSPCLNGTGRRVGDDSSRPAQRLLFSTGLAGPYARN